MPRSSRLDPWFDRRSDALNSLLLDWAHLGLQDNDRASAELLSTYLENQLFDDVRIIDTPTTAPAVFGQRNRAGAEGVNVLVVGLHDVPWLDGGSADDIRLDDNGLIGPGIASRFAPLLAHTEAYLGLTDEAEGTPAINLMVLAIDSLSLGTNQISTIVAAAELGNVDVIVAAPSVAWDLRAPTITLGARGELLVEIIASTGRDLQINTFAAATRNPLQFLTSTLADLRDTNGRITIPGFYNRAAPPNRAEREALSRDGYDPARWLVGTGSSVLVGGPPPLERASAWPSVDVVSINAGSGHRVRSQTIPGSASATVSISLVVDQRNSEVEASLRNWLDSRAVSGVDLALNVIAASEPYRVDRETPWVVCQARAAKRVFNRSPIPVLGGGTPGLAEISEAVGAPMLFSGIASPASFLDTGHERLSTDRFRLGLSLIAETFEQFAKRAARG